MGKQNNVCLVAFMHADELSGEIAELISALPFGNAEKERLLSIKNTDSQKNSLSALICLSSLLSHFDTNDKDLQIIRQGYGKPHFASLPLFFNVSHSRKLCAVALSDTNVGIDLEFISDARDTSALSKRFFTPQEHLEITESKNATEAFFAMWTKKEALAKLTGEGLAAICRNQATDDTSYTFREYEISTADGKAKLAICFDGSEGSIPTIEIITTHRTEITAQ